MNRGRIQTENTISKGKNDEITHFTSKSGDKLKNKNMKNSLPLNALSKNFSLKSFEITFNEHKFPLKSGKLGDNLKLSNKKHPSSSAPRYQSPTESSVNKKEKKITKKILHKYKRTQSKKQRERKVKINSGYEVIKSKPGSKNFQSNNQGTDSLIKATVRSTLRTIRQNKEKVTKNEDFDDSNDSSDVTVAATFLNKLLVNRPKYTKDQFFNFLATPKKAPESNSKKRSPNCTFSPLISKNSLHIASLLTYNDPKPFNGFDTTQNAERRLIYCKSFHKKRAAATLLKKGDENSMILHKVNSLNRLTNDKVTLTSRQEKSAKSKILVKNNSSRLLNGNIDVSKVSKLLSKVSTKLRDRDVTRTNNQESHLITTQESKFIDQMNQTNHHDKDESIISRNREKTIKKYETNTLNETEQKKYVKLYNRAFEINEKKSKMRKEFMKRVCPFTPNILDKNTPRIEHFEERQAQYNQRVQENEKKNLNQSMIDDRTGQRFFAPRLVSKQKDNERSLKISEDKYLELYEVSKTQQIRRLERINKHQLEINNKINEKKICVRSEQIADEIKREIFNDIFDKLKDGFSERIVGSEADITILPDYLKIFISTLISELKNQGESFDRGDFLLACEELYKISANFVKLNLFNQHLKNNRNSKSPSKSKEILSYF